MRRGGGIFHTEGRVSANGETVVVIITKVNAGFDHCLLMCLLKRQLAGPYVADPDEHSAQWASEDLNLCCWCPGTTMRGAIARPRPWSLHLIVAFVLHCAMAAPATVTFLHINDRHNRVGV